MDTGMVLTIVRAIHETLRRDVLARVVGCSTEDLAAVVADDAGDTTFAIDRIAEGRLVDLFTPLAEVAPLVLVAEGMSEPLPLPRGHDPRRAELRVIVDPLDGSRGLMYDKRSAWILTGVAPNHGPTTTLADIRVAVQTEVPVSKQHLADQLWAVASEGADGQRWDRRIDHRYPHRPRPSTATDIAQGFGGLARFIPGARAELATIDDEIYRRILGPPRAGKAQAFEDQYIASAGQLAELVNGHDRWIADVRALLEPWLATTGHPLGLCARPYDLCTELIAREFGVHIHDPHGQRLTASLDTTTDISWVGYANEAIRNLVHPVLQQVLTERGHLESSGKNAS